MQTDASDSFRGYLGQKLRVAINDGRAIEGCLECMDSSMNLIITAAEEFYPDNKGILIY